MHEVHSTTTIILILHLAFKMKYEVDDDIPNKKTEIKAQRRKEQKTELNRRVVKELFHIEASII